MSWICYAGEKEVLRYLFFFLFHISFVKHITGGKENELSYQL